VDVGAQLEWLLATLTQLGVECRREHLGGSGGGLCKLRGKRVFFLDLDADPASQAERGISALASFPDIEHLHLPPFIRERLECLRRFTEDAIQ
jgi:hypothetical protein